MRNNFSPEQWADPKIKPAATAVRRCVHCGFCTATCPTYVVLGDERDGPRGRIQFMQKMLEEGGTPSDEAVHHIDRCLSCLNCRTTCPSSVDYARLVDKSRAYIEEHYHRPLGDRFMRWLIATVFPYPTRTKLALLLAPLGRIAAFFIPMGRLETMLKKASPPRGPERLAIPERPLKRIALLPGCVQKAVMPEIDAAASRVLARRGIELVPLPGAGCCGALSHHLGREEESRQFAKTLITAWEDGRYDGIFISATGCGGYLKELSHVFPGDPVWQPRAEKFAAAMVDFLELVPTASVTPPQALRVAYHPPCSLQNMLKLNGRGEALLADAGFLVTPFGESHICCGSAGSYSILQPELSQRLRARKLGHIEAANPDVIVSGNIGCIQQLSGGVPVLHIAQLLDWAEGGPKPAALVLPHARH
ncbi:MAG: glycolate oxidase subunit GlcF [Alphaproteobacteria bacterium]|nr:glycolate oxidase subunit GlcF [Alphaproteobacteria bacterium]